ncbi:MAG: L,D-transpeptidase family protein [Dehalococcoidales bacterium]|nr:L,D-transpeptidase family protein [Dehalococcoidales bacterium]
MRRFLPLAIIIALAFTLVPLDIGSASAAPSSVTVAIDWANVRTAPSLSASVATRVYQGDKVIVTGTVNGKSVNGNSTWYRTKSGWYISATVVSGSAVASSTPPSTIPAGNRWIDVNLSTLTTRAMVGNTAIYSAPTVSGRPGWETPTGTFRILRRTPLTNMQSQPGWSDQYYQPNVPWVQYFTPYGHALHGNDYSPASYFGRVRSSHGCVGMSVADAKFLYNFGGVGMPVVIHY